jgi:prefoldin beta subunit
MKTENQMQEKINQIQVIEQNLHSVINQRQTFQAQNMEVESSLLELSKTKNAYKIIGNIMVATDAENLKKDLLSKKEMLDIRVKSVQKQEEKLKQKIAEIQKEVMDSMKNSDKK